MHAVLTRGGAIAGGVMIGVDPVVVPAIAAARATQTRRAADGTKPTIMNSTVTMQRVAGSPVPRCLRSTERVRLRAVVGVAAVVAVRAVLVKRQAAPRPLNRQLALSKLLQIAEHAEVCPRQHVDEAVPLVEAAGVGVDLVDVDVHLLTAARADFSHCRFQQCGSDATIPK